MIWPLQCTANVRDVWSAANALETIGPGAVDASLERMQAGDGGAGNGTLEFHEAAAKAFEDAWFPLWQAMNQIGYANEGESYEPSENEDTIHYVRRQGSRRTL